MFLTGVGSLIAKPVRRGSLTLYTLLIVLTALWPLLQIIGIRYFREAAFIHGAAPGFYQILFYILATTAPYCLLVGFILPYALEVLRDGRYPFTSGDLYITDSIGDITGGILFSFVLVYWVKPFKTIALTSGPLLLTGLLLLVVSRRYLLFMCALVLSSAFYLLAMNGYFEESTLARQYGHIARYLESPYGRIVITREGPQHTFWESGVPLYSDANTINSEEKIHYPLSQLDGVGNVLLVSGGLGETLSEVSKYHPERIDYVELDPHLTGAARELGFIRRVSGLHIVNADGRAYIKSTGRRYDAVIMDLPDPDTFQLNRFFTSEFFSLAKGVLSDRGILSFGLKYSPNYLSEVGKRKLSALYNTALLHFQRVLVLPGQEAYFLCRDGTMGTDIPERLERKGINTSYIRGFYRGDVTEDRIRTLRGNLDPGEFVNTDFEPRVMNIIFQEWFLKHGASPKWLLAAILGLTALYLMFMKREEYILFSTGLATMGVEMVVIFTFQVIYGFIYLKIGAVITAFLMGLLPGAVVGNHFKGKRLKSLIASEIILLSLLVLCFVWIRFFRSDLHEFYFLAYCFAFSFFCGYQFPAAAYLVGEDRSPAAACLAADLTGAALGTLLAGTLLIPLWGIQLTIIFLILIKISSNMILLFTKKREI